MPTSYSAAQLHGQRSVPALSASFFTPITDAPARAARPSLTLPFLPVTFEPRATESSGSFHERVRVASPAAMIPLACYDFLYSPRWTFQGSFTVDRCFGLGDLGLKGFRAQVSMRRRMAVISGVGDSRSVGMGIYGERERWVFITRGNDGNL